jgi:hypothetical protein
MSIRYQSNGHERQVNFTPRTEDSEPRVWTVTPRKNGHEAFLADLKSPGGSVPVLVQTVSAEGLAADVVADMWSRYNRLREAVAEHPSADWKAWASGKLAVRGAIEAPVVKQSELLLLDLTASEAALRKQHKDARLHPVAAAMRTFMYGQVQLVSLNGSTPQVELLPPGTYASPVEMVGMVALDLAQQPEPAQELVA